MTIRDKTKANQMLMIRKWMLRFFEKFMTRTALGEGYQIQPVFQSYGLLLGFFSGGGIGSRKLAFNLTSELVWLSCKSV